MRFLVAAITIFFGLSTQLRAEEEPVVYEPASAWVLDYAEDHCALSRLFQAENRELRFRAVQYEPGPDMYMAIAEPGLYPEKVRYRLRTDEEFSDPSSPLELEWEGMPSMLLHVDLRGHGAQQQSDETIPIWSAEQRERLTAEIDSIELRTRRNDMVLSSGNMQAPLAAMNVCLEDLTAQWGIDVEAHRKLTRRAAPENTDLFRRRIQSYFPAPSLRRGHQGSLPARVDIDARGKPLNCHVVQQLSKAAFEEALCRSMMKSQYLPALNADGDPIASYYLVVVNYLIPS